MFIVYWMDATRARHSAFVKARTHDEAYNFTRQKIQRGCFITAVYHAHPAELTPESDCLNFVNPKA